MWRISLKKWTDHDETRAADINPPFPAPGFEGMDLCHRTSWWNLWQLECKDKPGLTQEQFLGLFVKCDACGLINTHHMFHKHRCRRPQTMDESASDSEQSD